MSDELRTQLPDPAISVLVGAVALSFFLHKSQPEQRAIITTMRWVADRMDAGPDAWPLDFGRTPEELPSLLAATGLAAPWLRLLADQFAEIAKR